MARGAQAKADISAKIIETFGQDKVIQSGGKLYINTVENGEKIQICIALTCPKTMVGVEQENAVASVSAFSGNAFDSFGAPPVVAEPYKPAEITPEERDTVRAMMERLGL